MKSDNVKKGMQQAPHRSLFNALGLTEEEIAQQDERFFLAIDKLKRLKVRRDQK